MGTSDERRGELIEKGITVVTLEEKETGKAAHLPFILGIV